MDETTAHFGLEKILTFQDFWRIIVLDIVLTGENFLIVFSAWFFVRAVRHALPPKSKWVKVILRVRELVYIAMCSACMWAPGLRPEIEAWGFRVGLGICLAFVTTLVPWGLHHIGTKIGIDALKDARKVEKA